MKDYSNYMRKIDTAIIALDAPDSSASPEAAVPARTTGHVKNPVYHFSASCLSAELF